MLSVENMNSFSEMTISDHNSHVVEALDGQPDGDSYSGCLDESSECSNYCRYCDLSFEDEDELNNHCETPEHELCYYQAIYSSNRRHLIQDKKHMKITIKMDPSDPDFEEGTPDYVEEDKNGKIIIQIEKNTGSVSAPIYVKNLSDQSMDLLSAVKLYDCDRIQVSDEYDCIEQEKIARIPPGSSFKLIFTAIGGENCVQELPICFSFQDTEEEDIDEVFIILRVLVIEVVDELAPKEDEISIEKRKAILKYMNVIPRIGSYIVGIKPFANAFKRTSYEFYYPEELRKLVEADFKYRNIDDDLKGLLGHYWNLMKGGLTADNYKEWFKVQLWLEEIRKEDDYKNYHQIDVSVTVVYETRDDEVILVELHVPGLSEKRPGLLKTDSVFFRPHDKQEPIYEGVVHNIRGEYVHLGFDQDFVEELMNGLKVDVQFAHNRANFVRCQSALLKCDAVLHQLFPPTTLSAEQNEPLMHKTLDYFDDKIASNAEQKKAVKMIVNGTSAPYPYILFGPPGTGKTLTIVEAIKQIYKLNDDPRILVCGPSNSSCDILVERLLVHIEQDDILRVNAISRNAHQLSAKVKGVSFIKSDEIETPSLEFISTFKIVVCTYMSAYKIVSVSDPTEKLDFTHLFLDECGHGMEPESLIPLLSMSGNVVLTGDPKQLGPIVCSPFCKTESKYFAGAGLDQSLLERLMGVKPYVAVEEGNRKSFNKYYVTKLLNNFRSHKRILEVPNELFYDSELKARGDKSIVNSMLSFSELPNKYIPIIFKGVEGRDNKSKGNPSFFNNQEVTEVVRMLGIIKKKVNLEDIGIIAPYKTQIKKIRFKLKDSGKYTESDLKKLLIGSPEQFQGDERKVIIVSTVRASGELLLNDVNKQLGFLRNPKRFNVIITRAIAMLVVIGCPWILQMDNNWGTILKFCLENECYVGPPVDPLAKKENILRDRFDKIGWYKD